MTYNELVETIKSTFESVDVSDIKEHIAYQFNIEGDAEGIFYAEVSDGKVSVEPYEYFDRDVLFILTDEVLLKIMNGKLDAIQAFLTGKLKVEGDMDKALLLQKFAERSSKRAKKLKKAKK